MPSYSQTASKSVPYATSINDLHPGYQVVTGITGTPRLIPNSPIAAGPYINYADDRYNNATGYTKYMHDRAVAAAQQAAAKVPKVTPRQMPTPIQTAPVRTMSAPVAGPVAPTMIPVPAPTPIMQPAQQFAQPVMAPIAPTPMAAPMMPAPTNWISTANMTPVQIAPNPTYNYVNSTTPGSILKMRVPAGK